jgi:hypothetical protein
MHSNFYEVRISKIDPVVTRAPPGMQNMSYEQNYGQNEHLALARANKAPDGPNRSPAWPREFTKALRLPSWSGRCFGVHGSTGGATGAGFGLLYFESRIIAYLRPPALGLPGLARKPMPVLQQTAEDEKPLTRQTLALLQRDS